MLGTGTSEAAQIEMPSQLTNDPDPARALAVLESEMGGGEEAADQIAHLRLLLERECEAQVDCMIFIVFWHMQQMLGRGQAAAAVVGCANWTRLESDCLGRLFQIGRSQRKDQCAGSDKLCECRLSNHHWCGSMRSYGTGKLHQASAMQQTL